MHGDCPYISVPAGTNRSSDEVTNGLTVEYNCLDVTEIFENGRADMRIKCLSSGQWNELPQPCKGTHCFIIPLAAFYLLFLLVFSDRNHFIMSRFVL